MNLGSAFGEDGDDKLVAMSRGSGWMLDGGSGDDLLQFAGGGIAEGGEGSDRLEFRGQGTARVVDLGTAGADAVLFTTVATATDFTTTVAGNDLHVSGAGGGSSIGTVILDGYLAGTNGIEQLFAADGTSIAL